MTLVSLLNSLFRLKNEIEKLQAEHKEEIIQLQQKYKVEIESLKDQLLESDARRESLEREVILIINTYNSALKNKVRTYFKGKEFTKFWKN